ncbi:hypothetical protein Acr_11g0006340 [Actinidia rufa]|uniref:Rx N-terminal domain-containing protein n=1 Tax=Actinidia rufa TaxID=165716 RepID=A0A7J0FCE4_9ERIC|nr:hypothetical protein Acr_11g0006340 [Actinidia rufa]
MSEIALAGATSVLRQTIDVLSNLIVDEGSRLSRLREGILWIESEMRHIQSYLEDADANRKITSLVIDIRDLAYDVEDIMDTYFPRIISHRRKGIFSSVFSILRDGRDVWDARRTFAHVDEPYVVGFDMQVKELVTKLNIGDSRFAVISIVGMPGLVDMILSFPWVFWKMKQLRHLSLSFVANANFLRIDVSLPNLQSLHLTMLVSCRYVEGLRLNNLTSLRKLEINGILERRDTLNLSRCENLHKLSLGFYMKNLPDLDKLPPNLTKLTLGWTGLVECPLEFLKKLPKLKVLKLGEFSYESRQIICSGGPDNFPQLEVLEFHTLPKLEELLVEEGAMPRLKKLIIIRCRGLKVIPHRFRNITTTTTTAE